MRFIKRYGWVVIPLVIFSTLFLTNPSDPPAIVTTTTPELNTQDTPKEQISTEMKIDVKGEVKKPGVYSVRANMRVDDAIDLAGGMTSDADPTSVNLAQKLQDEMVILVSSIKAPTESASSSSNSSSSLVLNQATLEEIQSLDGIGPSKAAAIIKYREENGPFQSKEELLEVSGIGEKTLENIIEDIRVP